MGRNLILQAEYKHKKQPICSVPAIHSQNKGKLSLPANKLVGSSINYFHCHHAKVFGGCVISTNLP